MTTALALEVISEEYQQAAKVLEDGGYMEIAGTLIGPAFKEATNIVRSQVRAELKPHRRTGKMSSNVRTRVRGRGLQAVGAVRMTGAVGNLLVGGVSPHRIAPGRVMPLTVGRGAFKKGAGEGTTGFATAVQHQGFRGDPVFKRAISKSAMAVNEVFDQLARTIAQALALLMEG